MCVLPMCRCVLDAKPGDHGNQKKASDPLELELYAVGSCCVGAGNQVQAFRKSNKCSSPLSRLTSLGTMLFGHLQPLLPL